MFSLLTEKLRVIEAPASSCSLPEHILHEVDDIAVVADGLLSSCIFSPQGVSSVYLIKLAITDINLHTIQVESYIQNKSCDSDFFTIMTENICTGTDNNVNKCEKFKECNNIEQTTFLEYNRCIHICLCDGVCSGLQIRMEQQAWIKSTWSLCELYIL